MDIDLKIDETTFIRGIDAYRAATRKDMEQVMLRAFRGFMRRAMGITPPAYGRRGRGGALTHADKARGEAAIANDLAAIFVPVKLKHKRRERWPDVGGIHLARFIRKQERGQRTMSRGQASAYYVDRSKLAALARDLKKHVGRLAAGWLSGALAVKATGIPAWVRRHGTSGGTHTLILSAYETKLIVANTSVPPALVSELDRRIGYAVDYTGKAMLAEAEAILDKNNRRFNRT